MIDELLRIRDTIKKVNKISLFFSLLVLTKAVGFLPIQIPPIVDYGIMGLVALYCLKKSESLNFLYIAFVLYIVINILINNPNHVFNPWGRLGIFVILLFCVSSITQGEYVRSLRSDVLKCLMKIGVVLSVLSFFCWFLQINFMQRQFLNISVAGHFGGLFRHSMILGPVAAASAIYLFYKSLKLESFIYSIMGILCVGALFFSASRTALVAFVVGLLVVLISIKIKRTRTVKVLIFSTSILFVSFPIWGDYTEMMIEKNIRNIENGGVFSSRDAKWNARIKEFESSPLWGIGFASVDTKLDSYVDSGTVEPGSSWLCILSMLGLVGFLFFVMIIISSCKSCTMYDCDYSLLWGLMAFFLVCMITEGYIFAAGNYMSLLLWLVIGHMYDIRYQSISDTEVP